MLKVQRWQREALRLADLLLTRPAVVVAGVTCALAVLHRDRLAFVGAKSLHTSTDFLSR